MGYGNLVCASRVLGVIIPKCKTAKTLIEKAKEAETIIDVTRGKSTKSVILLDNGQIMLSHISPDTLKYRFSNLHRPETFRTAMKTDPNRNTDEVDIEGRHYDELFPDEEPDTTEEEETNE